MSLPALGIDIAKRKFQAALLVNGKVKQKSCSNTPEGFEELKSWLSRQKVERVHACLEATGNYGEALATALADAGHLVSIVNPVRIQGFAKSELIRTKTDAVDSALIARFCEALKPETWVPPAPEVRELRALVRRLSDLQEMYQMESNRLEVGDPSKAVRDSIRALVEHLQEEIDKTKTLIRKHIDRHPGLKAQRDLLTSIPGIADQTAATLLAELGDLSQFTSAKQVAAYAGLFPKERSSGTSVWGKPRLSKVGNHRLRKALYMPAIVAMRANPLISDHCARMLDKGKAKMAAVGAAMRKLLHLAYGVLKSGMPFDSAYTAAQVRA